MKRTAAYAGAWLLALGSLMASGCALTSKGEAIVPRFYSPDLPSPSGEAPSPGTTSAGLRLGRVRAGNDLKEQIVFRESPYEVGFYNDRLWAERPDVYLRRALAMALFEKRGVREVVSGPGPSLDVELTAFEEVRGEHPVARVRLTWALHDDLNVVRGQSLTVERPLPPSRDSASAPAFVQAISEALRAAVDDVATRVAAELSAVPAPPPVAPGVTPASPAGPTTVRTPTR